MVTMIKCSMLKADYVKEREKEENDVSPSEERHNAESREAPDC
jgi:hypothetical protein